MEKDLRYYQKKKEDYNTAYKNKSLFEQERLKGKSEQFNKKMDKKIKELKNGLENKKECTTCKKTLNLFSFYEHPKGKLGRRAECKICCSRKNFGYRISH